MYLIDNLTQGPDGNQIGSFGFGEPHAITPGSDGNLWFTDAGSNVGRITPTGDVTAFPVSVGSGRGITADPDGNIWFATHSTIGWITPAGALTEFPLAATSEPMVLTAGPDGTIWLTEMGRGIQHGALAAADTHDTVRNNFVRYNFRNGIEVGATQNDIPGQPSDNVRGGFDGFTGFDLHDLHPDCDANAWFSNVWGTGGYSPACTATGGSGPNPPGAPSSAQASASPDAVSPSPCVRWTPCPLEPSPQSALPHRERATTKHHGAGAPGRRPQPAVRRSGVGRRGHGRR